MTQQESDRIEQLLAGPCWVLDFLPVRVPADSPGQFFAVERYYRGASRMKDFRRRAADVLLKLNCYAGFRVFRGEEAADDPPPAALAELITDSRKPLLILVGAEDCLITLDPGDLYVSVYCPSEFLLSLLAPLAAASGLFLRKGAGWDEEG